MQVPIAKQDAKWRDISHNIRNIYSSKLTTSVMRTILEACKKYLFHGQNGNANIFNFDQYFLDRVIFHQPFYSLFHPALFVDIQIKINQ